MLKYKKITEKKGWSTMKGKELQQNEWYKMDILSTGTSLELLYNKYNIKPSYSK